MASNCLHSLTIVILSTCLTSEVTSFNVWFEKMSTLYLPYEYNPNQYGLGKDAAEQMAYDPSTKLLYSVGHTSVHVIDLSDPGYNMTVLYHVSYVDVDVTDVEVCGNFLFVAIDNRTDRTKGFVNVYEAYNQENSTLNLIHKILVGALPDMIHPTADCSKVLIAVEAEPYTDNSGQCEDPTGGVGIIKFSSTPDGDYTYKLLDFDAFNSRVADLEKSGVRFVYQGNNNTFSNDVEPEYIAFNHDETKAYLSLQENNAIAVVDLRSETIVDIFGLGFKNWSVTTLDPSDEDGGIHMNSWPVFGMYQPDSIKVWTHNNIDYILTANEGDSKDYGAFSEETSVGHEYLSTIFEPNITERDWLQSSENLGRLKITNVNGKNLTTGEFDQLYSFGARSFSIWRADNMEQVYDSGNEISHRISMLKPYLFNSDPKKDKSIIASQDKRSDNKGPETESLVTAQFGNYTLVIVGNERPGVIAVYSIDNRLPTIQPRFETLISDIPQTNETWQHVYDTHRLSMLDPEDIRFVPASESPHGEALLLVSGSYSGTVTILKVTVDNGNNQDDPGDINSAIPTKTNLWVLLLTVIIFLVKKCR